MNNEAIIYKDTILYDKRYRKEYSDKSYSSSMGQKVNRHWRTKNVNEDKIGYKVDRSIEQRNERRMKRKKETNDAKSKKDNPKISTTWLRSAGE